MCESPITVRRKDLKTALKRWRRSGCDPNKKPGPFVQVPCGKCISCLKTKRNQMLWRLNRSVNFAKYKSYFLTLTYDEEHLPMFCRDTNSYLEDKETYMPQVTILRPSVQKRDVQLFFKRLRKYISDHDLEQKDEEGKVLDSERFRYFLTSEYGSKTKRPHYHAVIINFKHDPMLFEHCWKNGIIYVGDSSPASINYVAKYFVFKQDNPFGTVKNFSLSSNGIGNEQLYVLNDFLRAGNLLSLPNGAKIQTPSYVLNKLNLTTFNIKSKEHVSKPDLLIKRLNFDDPRQCKRVIDSYNATNKDLFDNFKKRKTEKL